MRRQNSNLNDLRSMTLLVMILLCLELSSFNSIAFSKTPRSPAEEKRNQFLSEANNNRNTRTRELERMNAPQLAAELTRESLEGIAPFNSFAYKAVVKKPDLAIPLARLLTAPEQSSFLGLLALREINRTEYQKLSAAFRVSVLVDALKHTKYFNAWGLPNLRWHEAAEALIAEKDAARPALVPLLQTTGSRNAPVLGLKSHDVYEEYQYRVSDYALALLNDINRERKILPVERILRDRLINELAMRNGLPKPVVPIDPRVRPPGLRRELTPEQPPIQ